MSDLICSVQVLSCFYSFEMTAVIVGHIDYLKSNIDGIIYVDNVLTFKNVSIEKMCLNLMNIEKKPHTTRRLICNSKLLLEELKGITNQNNLEEINLENDENELVNLYDLHKGWKNDGKLIFNVEIPLALKHLKLGFYGFIKMALIEIKRSNVRWYYEIPEINYLYDGATGRRIY